MHNHLRTFTLLAALTALFMGIGFMIGGASGMLIALVLAGGMNLFSYWNSDKILLKMHGAQEVDEAHPEALVRNYVRDVFDMADGAGMPRPKVYVMATDQPNAFATGRNPENAAVAATQGLLRMLEGEVRLVFVDPPSEQLVTPDRPAIIPPQATHHVVPLGPMTMQVEFYRERPELVEDADRG